jgi:hypothetical protein
MSTPVPTSVLKYITSETKINMRPSAIDDTKHCIICVGLSIHSASIPLSAILFLLSRKCGKHRSANDASEYYILSDSYTVTSYIFSFLAALYHPHPTIVIYFCAQNVRDARVVKR